MKTMLRTFGCLVMAVLMFGTGRAWGGKFELAPAGSAVTAVLGTTRAALRFDVSSLQGFSAESGRRVYLEWTLSGVPANSQSEFNLYLAASSWQGGTGVGALSLGEDSYSTWDIEPIDYERAGGLVRFEVTELVVGWLETPATNHGLVITTTALSSQSLGEQLGNARLVLR